MALGKWATRRIALALASAATAVVTTACAAVAPLGSAPGAAPTAVSASAPSPGVVMSASIPATAHSATARPSATRATPAAKAPATSAAPTSPASATAGSPPAQPSAGARLVTFVNKTSQTIWVAASPDPSAPIARTGWVVPPGQSVTTTVANRYSGRIWGRTGCVFSANGIGHCQTGDCGGKFQCTGWGTIPATLFEIDMDAWMNMDFEDVSMVDGSNLPMYINMTNGTTKDPITSAGCISRAIDPGCTKPVNCPAALQVKAAGQVVGCISPCARFNTDQYCCRGPWAPRADCDPAKWPVDYATVFKQAEPYAYSYTDDDATSVFTCKGDCDYRVTFGITP
jgi:hypothetical protein